MNDAMKLAINQSFVNNHARIMDDEAMISLISAYNLYMKYKTESGATDEEKEIMNKELSAIYTTIEACHRLTDWVNG